MQQELDASEAFKAVVFNSSIMGFIIGYSFYQIILIRRGREKLNYLPTVLNCSVSIIFEMLFRSLFLASVFGFIQPRLAYPLLITWRGIIMLSIYAIEVSRLPEFMRQLLIDY